MLKHFFVTILLSLGLTGLANAQWVATQGTNAVVALQDACPASVSKHIEPAYRARFKKAEGLVDGKTYTGCWTVEQGVVFLIWEDGDQGIIPEKEFRKLKEA